MISAVMFGSGAFTTVEAERDITVELDSDDSANIQLQSNLSTDLVTDGNDQIQFDFSGTNSTNVNSTVRFGNSTDDNKVGSDLGQPPDAGAFEVVNSDDDSYDIRLQASDQNNNNITLYASNGTKDFSGDDIKFQNVSNGDDIQVAIEIDTADSSGNDFASNITVTAERSDV